MALIAAGWAAFSSMGGHQTKQTVLQSTKISADVVQKTTNNCLTTVFGQNCLNVSGTGNRVSGTTQSVTIGKKTSCSTLAKQNNTFENDLKSAISQALEDKQVAGTQWMDTSKDENLLAIKRDIEARFTQETVQACVDNITVGNCINVHGSYNTVEDVKQTAVADAIASKCVLDDEQTSHMVNKITDTANQHATYTSENPLAFIGDAIKGIANSIAAVAAVIIIVMICFVFLFFMMSRGGSAGAAAASAFPSLPPIILQPQMPGMAGMAGY